MMPLRFIYNILITLAWFGLKVIALFQPKIKLFVTGRRRTFGNIEANISANTKTIWMHVASLGEFEQGLPILERLKKDYPQHKIVLSFFSPSGYEVKKETSAADVVVYLPMDTISNAKKFLKLVKPEVAIFVKYEIWPNYLHELKKHQIPTLLVSTIFSKRQVYFKPYGSFMRNSLKTFSHFFVQDEDSKQLLESIGFKNTTIGGDTRLDRVSEILKRDNSLDFMDNFVDNTFCVVAGSTWPEDEQLLINYINRSNNNIKFVIAPHEIKTSHVQKITDALQKRTICYSEMDNKDLGNFDVLVVDTIGLLTKIYSYGKIACVGGGFATGLHNTLEPAVYGIPVIIGPNYKGFKEAEDLVKKGGVLPISNQQTFDSQMDLLVKEPLVLKKTGQINSTYIEQNIGATDLILKHIAQFL